MKIKVFGRKTEEGGKSRFKFMSSYFYIAKCFTGSTINYYGIPSYEAVLRICIVKLHLIAT